MRRWVRRVAELTLAGVRRDLHIDLDSVAHLRPEIGAAVAEVAALPVDKRQVALADSGLLAPHWPKPYGRDASPAEQLLIDQQLTAAGCTAPIWSSDGGRCPTILEAGTADQIEHFPRDAAGELIWCQLFSEPGLVRTWPAAHQSRTRRGGWTNGQKVWTSAAHKADWGRAWPAPTRKRLPSKRESPTSWSTCVRRAS